MTSIVARIILTPYSEPTTSLGNNESLLTLSHEMSKAYFFFFSINIIVRKVGHWRTLLSSMPHLYEPECDELTVSFHPPVLPHSRAKKGPLFNPILALWAEECKTSSEKRLCFVTIRGQFIARPGRVSLCPPERQAWHIRCLSCEQGSRLEWSAWQFTISLQEDVLTLTAFGRFDKWASFLGLTVQQTFAVKSYKTKKDAKLIRHGPSDWGPGM